MRSAPKPLPNDTSKDCATGWCDPKDGQFADNRCIPTNSDSNSPPRYSSPKTDHKR